MNTINATEARAMTDSVKMPIEVVFSCIKSQSEIGCAFTYVTIDEDTKSILSNLGYLLTPSSQQGETRVGW